MVTRDTHSVQAYARDNAEAPNHVSPERTTWSTPFLLPDGSYPAFFLLVVNPEGPEIFLSRTNNALMLPQVRRQRQAPGADRGADNFDLAGPPFPIFSILPEV